MHYTPDSATLEQLHDAVLDVVAIINRPDRDALLIREAGIRLDRALFPLMVLIARRAPIGVVDLAARVGRDHSTVSRQVAKLIDSGLVERRPSATDRRIGELSATAAGKTMAGRIDEARERLARRALRDWGADEVDSLRTQLRRFADALAEQ